MRVDLDWGGERLTLEIGDANWIPLQRSAPVPAVKDVAAAVRAALEEPMGFPALRRALTPDDHVAIAVDESVPGPTRFLVPLLEHLESAGVAPAAVTLLCLPPSTGQPWLEDLPDAFQDVQVEVHDPSDRKKLSYLATTKKGRRIYLNRTAVDSEQLIVLNRLTYDPLVGVTAGDAMVFPGLADAESHADILERLSLETPDSPDWETRQEAGEVSWLLGAPFLLQVVAGEDDEVAHVVSGTVESSRGVEKLLHARWRVEVERPADVVIATITGDPRRQTMLELGRAFQAAARVVKSGGKIVLLTRAAPRLGPSAEIMRGEEEPGQALRMLMREKPADLEAAFLWTSAAEQAKLYLLSDIPAEDVEEMFVTPLEEVGQAKRFVGTNLSCIVLPDANQTLAVLRQS